MVKGKPPVNTFKNLGNNPRKQVATPKKVETLTFPQKLLYGTETRNPYFGDNIMLENGEICFDPNQNMACEIGYPNTQIVKREKLGIVFYTALIEQRIPFMIVVYDKNKPPPTSMLRVVSFNRKNYMSEEDNNKYAQTFYNWMTQVVTTISVDPNNLRFYLIPGINSTDDISVSIDSLKNPIKTLIIDAVKAAVDADEAALDADAAAGRADAQNKAESAIVAAKAAADAITQIISIPSRVKRNPAVAAAPKRELRLRGKGGKSKRNKSKKGTKRRNKSKKRKTRKYKK